MGFCKKKINENLKNLKKILFQLFIKYVTKMYSPKIIVTNNIH